MFRNNKSQHSKFDTLRQMDYHRLSSAQMVIWIDYLFIFAVNSSL